MTPFAKCLAMAAFAAITSSPVAAAEIQIGERYLHIPVARAGETVNVRLLDGEEIVRYFDVALPESKRDPLFWTSIDVGDLLGKTLSVRLSAAGGESDFVALCEQSGSVRTPPNAYREPFRPQFHFTPMVGWTNDPNGLVYLDGEYHLFFQHNPYGAEWGNMTWGHAVSRDLLHWRELGDAIQPDRLGTIYSGSAVVDRKNTAGFRTGPSQPIVAIYTAAGSHAPEPVPFTQALAYSNDRGRAWTKYESNPVVEFMAEGNRDPKVFWHQASGQWVMVLWLARGRFVLMGSKNLREWEKLSDIEFPDGYECPELFELRVDGDRKNTRWVMWEGGGRYLIGRFDGREFTAETGVLPSELGAHSYAAQSWNDVPDGRRILIAWMRATVPGQVAEPIYPGMPFNQQMSIPRVLTLRTTPEGIRLHAEPIREVEKLREKEHRQSGVTLRPGSNPLAGIEGELFDIEADLEPGQATTVTLNIRGTPLVYNAEDGTLSCLGKSARVELDKAHLRLRVLVDRTSIEIFAGGGRYVMSFCFRPEAGNRTLSLTASGGTARAASLRVSELRSIWDSESSQVAGPANVGGRAGATRSSATR